MLKRSKKMLKKIASWFKHEPVESTDHKRMMDKLDLAIEQDKIFGNLCSMYLSFILLVQNGNDDREELRKKANSILELASKVLKEKFPK